MNECHARLFQRRIKPNCEQSATFQPILEKKTALILSCWRYFDVQTLFSLHFTRRTLCTPVWASKQALRQRKSHPFTWFCGKLSVISFLLVIFWSLNAIFIAFYTLNVVHAVFTFERSTSACKSQQFTRFCGKVSVISFLLEIFRRLIAISARFQWTNATHVCFNVETSPTVRNMLHFTRFWRKNSVNSLRLGILWSLNAIFIHLTRWT